MKRRMTEQQEFEIMKLVLDKFLWLGFLVMGWGVFKMERSSEFLPGLWYVLGGAVILVIFVVLIVKEYEVIS